MTYQPLAGVRVLELARLLPGPMLTRKFADLGAEVVKIEEPGRGDYLRWMPPIVEGAGVLFNLVNRGKKSLELDMKSEEGRDTFLDLALHADVVVEGSRPGAFDKHGVDWSALLTRKPSLVICSISGFGQTGPLATLPSHGHVLDALAGAASLVEINGRAEIAQMTSWSVEVGTASAAFATLAALTHARATGEGAWIDASLWDASVEAQRAIIGPMLAGVPPYGSERGPLGGVYLASDEKPVSIVSVERKFWVSFCEGVRRPDLIDLWGGAGAAGRGEMAVGDERLRTEIAAIIATAPAATWTARFVAWGVPGGQVVSPAELLASPHFQARGLVGRSATGEAVLGDSMRFIQPELRPGIGTTPPPVLGADTDQVLGDWLRSDGH